MAPFRWRASAAGLLLAAVLSLAKTAAAVETRPQGIGPAPPAPTGIVINLPARTLYWFVDGQVSRVFPVGVGRTTDQTPTGSYRIQNKAVHPWWQPPWGGAVVPPGPQNPLGTRWMAFNGSYGIHGNNLPDSIGGTVSAGCIRMYNADVEWLYEQVKVGTPVNVIYETAQIQYGPDGRRYLAIYPNVYGFGSEPATSVLAAAGIDTEAVKPEGPGLYLLDAQALVNGQAVPAILKQGTPYVGARALAARMGADAGWDADTRTVALDGQSVTTVLQGSTGYVAAEEAAAVLGVEYEWNAGNATVLLKGTPIFLSGHLLSRRGTALDGEAYLPVRAVGEAAGATIGWDGESRRATVNGAPVDSVLHGDRAYAQAELLARVLNLRLQAQSGLILLER
ncbi:MAG TPA: L,D-transpeptidase family protein [Symbiobacteriaceae bacterium]|nr:L,D-transpeptidase family protein [Symbiobacteriaceae bacterium]